MNTPVVLSYGMGVDSSTILARWLREPSSRDFDLKDLVVLTAQTGDEFHDTKVVVEKHIYPLLREHKVRTVQVARKGPLQRDGVATLDDSHQPTKLYTEGSYKLSQELLATGTVAQVGNRRCSQKAKGVVNDTWLAENVRHAYRHVMGFNADETLRIDRDSCYGGDNRNTEYPLMQWGWGRERCEQYLADTFGVRWPKSCCMM